MATRPDISTLPVPPEDACSSPRTSWKTELAAAVRDPEELLALLGIGGEWREGARRAARLFPLLAPHDFIRRMEPGNVDDPLLRQVLPLDVEADAVPGFRDDPVGDLRARRAPGLLCKYPGRALLIASPACAVNCRYCFRRHFPYAETPRGEAAWRPALDALSADAALQEVILSGGDPLTLTDESLTRLIASLAAIPHVRWLRVHTRLPVVLPSRVTPGLLDLLRSTRLPVTVVVHANHAAELRGTCPEAITQLVDHGIPVLNQAVLLRGVNDTAGDQVALCQRLLDLRVRPYYLNHLDRVAGAAHFDVPESAGKAIAGALAERLPGHAVPRYVRDVEGAAGKVAIH